jgi:isoquinoline 1-oxidoreductase alpha subunit
MRERTEALEADHGLQIGSALPRHRERTAHGLPRDPLRATSINEAQMVTLTINGEPHQLDVTDDTMLLWAVRDVAGLTGTKFGCGMSLCGACTVHLDGEPIRSCVTPVSAAIGKQLTTIEAIGKDPVGQRVQEAWRELDVVQCGYCQSGQIMQATALLRSNPRPSDADIDAAMSGNICRCGTYKRIRSAIKRAAEPGA